MKARTKVEIVSLHAHKTKMQYSQLQLTLRRVEISFLAISTIWHWQKNNWSGKEFFLQLLVTKTYLSEVGKDFYLKCCKNKTIGALSGQPAGQAFEREGEVNQDARPRAPKFPPLLPLLTPATQATFRVGVGYCKVSAAPAEALLFKAQFTRRISHVLNFLFQSTKIVKYGI